MLAITEQVYNADILNVVNKKLEALGSYDSNLSEAGMEAKVNRVTSEFYKQSVDLDEFKSAYEEVEASVEGRKKDMLKMFLERVAKHKRWAIRGYDEASKKARMINRVRAAVNPEVKRTVVELIKREDISVWSKERHQKYWETIRYNKNTKDITLDKKRKAIEEKWERPLYINA
jgi:hypothetical protein